VVRIGPHRRNAPTAFPLYRRNGDQRMTSRNTRTALEKTFGELGIDISRPGFYDDPRFVLAERRDSRFLEKYAEYVRVRNYDSAYLARARTEIPLILPIVFQELAKDGRLGACIDIGLMLSRILEHEGFWNYITKGSLTLTFAKETGIRRKYFWTYDPAGTPGFTAAHAWIAAPPYFVVDVAVKQQPYSEGRNLMPEYVLDDIGSSASPTAEDVFSPEFRALASARLGVPERSLTLEIEPRLTNFLERFPASHTTIGQVDLKYVPTAIGAPDAPFEEMNNWQVNGRLGIELYNELVSPALRLSRATSAP
jgi:hypothetical protein